MTLHKSVSLFGISIGRGVVLCLCFTWLVAEVVIGKLAQCGCGLWDQCCERGNCRGGSSQPKIPGFHTITPTQDKLILLPRVASYPVVYRFIISLCSSFLSLNSQQ